MDKLIHRDTPQKLYIQLCDIMKGKIEGGEWDVGFQIPTEEELCRTYGVSRVTVRAAITELVRNGYLTRQQGKGTFVYKRIVSGELTMLTTFREFLIETGPQFSTELLTRTTIMPVDDLSIRLNVPLSEHVIYLRRLRRAEDMPALIQDAYVPLRVCPGLLEDELEQMPLVELFEKRYSIPITLVRAAFDITALRGDEASIFGLPEGSQVVALHKLFFSWEEIVMYSRTVNGSDRIKFALEFEKKYHE